MIKKSILSLAIAGMFATSVFTTAYPAHASTIADSVREQMQEVEDGKTIAEKIQEQMNEGDSEETVVEEAPITESEDTDIPTLIEGIDMSTAEGVTQAIEAIRDANQVSRSDLLAIRQAYNSLPMSEQILVENIDVLKAQEERKGISSETETPEETQAPTNTNRPDMETKLRGNQYTFGIAEASPSVSLVARFVTDADGDGRSDIPDIVFMCPDTEKIQIDLSAPEIYSEKIDAAITMTDNFVQFDVSSADAGNWTVTTSAEVIFEKLDYQGVRENPQGLTESEAEMLPAEPQAVEESFLSRYGKLIGLVAVFAVLIFAALFLPKLLVGRDKTEPGEEERIKKKEKKNIEKAKKEDAKEGRARKLTEDEEIAQIRAEFEAQQKKYEEMDAENERRVKEIERNQKKERTPDEIYYVTQQDIDNDDSIEEYDEGFGTGLLTKENDSVNSDAGEFPDRFGKKPTRS